MRVSYRISHGSAKDLSLDKVTNVSYALSKRFIF